MRTRPKEGPVQRLILRFFQFGFPTQYILEDVLYTCCSGSYNCRIGFSMLFEFLVTKCWFSKNGRLKNLRWPKQWDSPSRGPSDYVTKYNYKEKVKSREKKIYRLEVHRFCWVETVVGSYPTNWPKCPVTVFLGTFWYRIRNEVSGVIPNTDGESTSH